MTIRPPIPEIQFDLENSRSKAKVKSTPVSAASCWLISLCFTSGHPIDSHPFRSMTIGPPISEIQLDLENSRSKVKGIPVSAVSSWLISLVYHIRASYRLPSLSFHDNRASHSRKVRVKGQGQRYPNQHSIPLTHFLFVSHQLDQPFLRYGKYNVPLQKTDLKFSKKSLK